MHKERNHTRTNVIPISPADRLSCDLQCFVFGKCCCRSDRSRDGTNGRRPLGTGPKRNQKCGDEYPGGLLMPGWLASDTTCSNKHDLCAVGATIKESGTDETRLVNDNASIQTQARGVLARLARTLRQHARLTQLHRSKGVVLLRTCADDVSSSYHIRTPPEKAHYKATSSSGHQDACGLAALP